VLGGRGLAGWHWGVADDVRISIKVRYLIATGVVAGNRLRVHRDCLFFSGVLARRSIHSF